MSRNTGCHIGLTAEDTMFYLTTCGWMMWNWLVSGLASGCTLLLYDGSPMHPDAGALWKIAAAEGVSVFGASAAYLKAMENAGERPAARVDLSALRALLSTGSPLAPRSYDYAYREIAADIMLASIAAARTCWAVSPRAIRCWACTAAKCNARRWAWRLTCSTARGARCGDGRANLCAPAPSLDAARVSQRSRGRRISACLFRPVPGRLGAWRFAEITRRGGVIIHGRSDAVLNPRGIRIGTAEIYRVAEALEEVEEALAVGQQHEGDTRIILFLRLAEGIEDSEALRGKVRGALRRHASPRHVPARIIIAPDLPRTVNGKISELAVRELIHGREVGNSEALANPESLDFFARLETELA